MKRLEGGGVLDASVGVKLALLDEESGDLALMVLGLVKTSGAQCWASPGLFDLECASAMLKAVRAGAVAPGEAAEGLGLIRRLPQRRIALPRIADAALCLALAVPISVYDACYVALSDRLEVPLVTADRRLVRTLAGTGHQIVLLADLEV